MSGHSIISLLPFLFILIVAIVIILFIIGHLHLNAKLKESSRLRGYAARTSLPDTSASIQSASQQNVPVSYVKRCPTCRSIFTDESLAFCLSDGAALERIPDTFSANSPNAVAVQREAGQNNVPPTVLYHPGISPDKKD
jgi:hypothetical protein